LRHQSQQDQQQQDKTNRVIANSDGMQTHEWIDFFLKKETDYYGLYKTYWKELQILIDRINFYYLWTNNLLKNEDEKRWFEHWLDVLMELLTKNTESLDQIRTEDTETVSQKLY